MQKDIRQQYNQVSKEFLQGQFAGDKINRDCAYRMVEPHLAGAVVLDLCCGGGGDAGYFVEQGAKKVIGLDASSEMIVLAKSTHPGIQFDVGFAEHLPYNDGEFDCVYSKYALQTCYDLALVFAEVFRVLKSGGIFVYLVAHPLRQFLEKKRVNADYFKQEVVDSVIFEGTVKLREPTHTFAEYFSRDFFERFEMLDYTEAFDPTSEQVNGAVYPGFMVVKARKK